MASIRKLERQRRALRRFSVLSATEYSARSRTWRKEDSESLGAMLATVEDRTAYEQYQNRKRVEEVSLIRAIGGETR